VDVNKIDMSASLLGYGMPSPIIVAPTGAHKITNPEGTQNKSSHLFLKMIKYVIRGLVPQSPQLLSKCSFQGRWPQQELQQHVTLSW
jgi:isopentenyl diphosphate isomerase/L-lactate dehydrogenase-like FMN-dependent dehydrogenase